MLGCPTAAPSYRFVHFRDQVFRCARFVQKGDAQTGVLRLSLIHAGDHQHGHGWANSTQFTDERISAGPGEHMISENDSEFPARFCVPQKLQRLLCAIGSSNRKPCAAQHSGAHA